MSSTRRTIRVAEVIKKELDVLIRHEVELDGVMLTITGVDPAPDLKHALVYIRILQTDTEGTRILNLLNKRKLEFQRAISRRLPIKFTPRLVFRIDNAQERGDKIFEILQQIDIPESTPPAPEEDPHG